MLLVTYRAISGLWGRSLECRPYLEPKVVALNHGFSVVLLQRGRLGLLSLSIELQGEHAVHAVDGGAYSVAQLERVVLKSPRPPPLAQERQPQTDSTQTLYQHGPGKSHFHRSLGAVVFNTLPTQVETACRPCLLHLAAFCSLNRC